jgi:hypothetical protein
VQQESLSPRDKQTLPCWWLALLNQPFQRHPYTQSAVIT